MKKLLVGLTAVVMMALGLVGVSSGPVQARDCGYQGCVWTEITKKNDVSPLKHGTAPTIKFSVKAVGGDPAPSAPSGNIIVVCTSPNGLHLKTGTGDVVNGKATVTLDKPLRKKGIWVCEAKYKGDNPFRRDSLHFRIRVV